jgi:hypothetical protein
MSSEGPRGAQSVPRLNLAVSVEQSVSMPRPVALQTVSNILETKDYNYLWLQAAKESRPDR